MEAMHKIKLVAVEDQAELSTFLLIRFQELVKLVLKVEELIQDWLEEVDQEEEYLFYSFLGMTALNILT